MNPLGIYGLNAQGVPPKSETMIGENRQLVTNEPVEVEK